MSNFNLVSDESNGHNYTCYFGEDIVIEPNSKVYLNFASLLREGREVLTEDATVTVTADALLPRKIMDGPTAVDNTFTGTVTIPAGNYSNGELETKIKEAIDSVISTTTGGEKLQYYTSTPEESSPEGTGLVSVSLALAKGTFDITDPDFVLDASNQFNATSGSGATSAYEKSGEVATTDKFCFDNYSLDDLPSWHYAYNSTQLTDYPSAMTFGFDTRSQGSLLMALYGNGYADLPNPSGATPPMTNGLVRPVLVTVDQPAEEVDPALGFSDSFVLDELGGSQILDGPTTGSFYEGFKVDVSTTSSTSDAVCYVNVTETPGSEGVLDFTGATGSITGLGNNVVYDLTGSGGAGTGFIIQVESNASGQIPSARLVAEGKITAPGTGYVVGDVITLTETTVPGTGSITITVTELAKYGAVESFRWVQDTADYRLSPYDANSNTLSMGANFVGEQTVTISQDSNAGGTTDSTTSLSDNATSACFGVPATFLSVIKRGSQSQPLSTNSAGAEYEVYFAKDSSGNFIGSTKSGNTDWTSQDVAIARMEKIGNFTATLSRGFQTLAIKPYYDSSIKTLYDGDSKKLFFQIIDITATTQILTPVILFDSKITGHYFPFSFFTGITPTTQAEVDLQIPFKLMLSAQLLNAGFQAVESEKYVEDPTGSGEVGSICEKATISFSSNLAQILSATTPSVVYPTSDPDDPLTYALLDASLFWRNKSYYVTIDEIPLSNYKNRRTVTQSGTGRLQKGKMLPVLSNIPLPFESVASALKDEDLQGTLVGSVYEPPKKVITSLLNQRISTNRLSVKVFRMDSDVLADEIKQSIINFTIMPPGMEE